MSIGNSARAWSRRDIVKIARRFNAGLGATTPQVPEGRLKSWHVIRQLQYIETFPGVETPGYFHLVPPGPLAQSGTSQILILMILPPMILPVPW